MIPSVHTKEQVFDRVYSHRATIRQFGAARLGLFGSFVRGQQKEDSDVDLMVEFEAGKKTIHNLLDLADYLESLLARKVDLLTWEGVAGFVQKYVATEIEYVALAD
ncbi:MAG: nucleotidyltransferase family protein [Sphingobacteriaceae bacterium]|nr:nucleotidyltransferase family protein [Cytophagaceae bacterium]